MDILNSDLQLHVESRTRKKASTGPNDDDDDSSFHFIAFMPVMGQVWKFDGLERQPQSIGKNQINPIDSQLLLGACHPSIVCIQCDVLDPLSHSK